MVKRENYGTFGPGYYEEIMESSQNVAKVMRRKRNEEKKR